MSHETFQAGDLTAVIGDNAAYDDRRPGYNGIHRLVHRTKPDTSLFGIAGLNLEHIYFKDPKGWVQLCTQEHNNQSTVRHVDDKRELAFTPVREQTLYKNFSPLRYAEPFFYGYFGASHVFVLMFDRAEGIRFSHSPSSGGAPSFPNPAWDFQFIIPQYEVLQNYGFRARAVYRERCSREEIEREYRTWRAAL